MAPPLLLLSSLRRVLRPSRTLTLASCCGREAAAPLTMGGLLWSSRRRSFGTHSAKEPIEPLNTEQGSRDFVCNLHWTERTSLLRELQRFESLAAAQATPGHRYSRTQIPVSRTWRDLAAAGETMEIKPPSSAQRRYVFLHSAIPFVGFGFLDNAIMIVAGTQIELSIGVIFGISTMAAAALGNLVSDVAGLGLAGYVEALAYRLGLPCPDLSPKQADMWQTRVSSQLGKVIGVTIGCCLGMFPLFFLKSDDEEIPEETSKLIEVNTIDPK